MGRAGGAGEVRLPRPEDADRAADPRSSWCAARHRDRPLRIPLDDAKTYDHAGARRDRRHLPGGRSGHAPRAHRHAAGPLRGHHRAGRALSARPDGEHPDLLRAQARHGAARLHPSEARADPARDLRRHRLSGAGDAGRAACCPATRSARPTCCAAPWARRSAARWRRSASASSPARSSAASRRAQAEAIFELLERFADYGFNKSHAAAYALVAYQTAYMKANYPVEFLAASMTLDMGNTDKLAEFRAEARAARHQGRAALDQPLGRRLRGRRQHDPLCAGRAARASAGRRSRRSSRRAARSRSRDLADFASRINPRAVNKRVLESLAAAGAFDALESEPRARLRRRRCDARHRAARARGCRDSARTELFGGPAAREPIVLPAVEPWLPAERLQREFDAIGFFLSGHPLDDYAAALKRLRVQSWAEFAQCGEAGRERRPRRRHGGGAHRAAHQDRQQDGHHRALRSVAATTRR